VGRLKINLTKNKIMIVENSDGRLIIHVSRNLGPDNPFYKTDAEKAALKVAKGNYIANMQRCISGFRKRKEGSKRGTMNASL
jgi:hypothetical protein